MSLLDQIAKETGVTTRTVVNVLQGRNKLVWPSAIRRAEEIRAAAERLGYLPNSAAIATATGRFGAAALILSTLPYVSNLPGGLLTGVHDELALHDMHLTLIRLTDEQLSDERAVPKILRQWMVDGLLIDYNFRIPPDLGLLIDRHKIPAVWINADQQADCVCPDDFGAGEMAAQHLLGLGHRRIAYADFCHVRDEPEEHYSASARYRGCETAMRRSGGSVRRLDDVRTPVGARIQMLEQALTDESRVTAIVGYGNYEVELAWHMALRLGLRIPEDLTLMTFSSGPLQVAETRFTCLVVPELEVGRAAVRMLLRKIEGGMPEQPVERLPFTLAAGETSGQASSR